MTEQNIGEVEMTGDPIEDAFKTHQPDVAETEEAQEVETPVDEVEEQADQDDGEDSETEQPFPKKAVNAISRHKKNANKYKAERDAFAKEIEALKKQVETSKTVQRPSEPKLDEFDTVSEYLKAQARYETQNALSDHENQRAEDRLQTLESQRKDLEIEEKVEYVSNQAVEFIEKVPDAKEYMQKYTPLFDAWEQQNPDLVEIIYSLDNAPQAIYNLAKSGAIETLASRPIQLAAAMLYQAQMTQPKVAPKVSQAPKPISAVKGGGASKTSLNSMSPDKLVEWVNS